MVFQCIQAVVYKWVRTYVEKLQQQTIASYPSTDILGFMSNTCWAVLLAHAWIIFNKPKLFLF